LIFHEGDIKLFGVHVIGDQAMEVVPIGLSVRGMNGDANVFIYTCYNYPTLIELYKYATYAALGNQKT